MILSQNIYAETLKAGSGLALPPYILGSGTAGMEYEIVKSSLEKVGFSIEKVSLFPFSRLPKTIAKGQVDLAFPMRTIKKNKEIHFSEPHITYQNVVVHLDKMKINIDKMEDLKNYQVIGFQNATKYLGEKFKNVVDGRKKYSEIANQKNQVKMLFVERTEAIVLDINIFKYFLADLLSSKSVKLTDYKINFKLFDPTEYRVAFSKKEVRDKFNQGLTKVKKEGLYDKIIDKYVGS